MKSDSLMSLLVAVLFANAAATALLSFHYVRSIAQRQRLTPLLARDQQAYAALNRLGMESVEYWKTHPAIGPYLRDFVLKTNPPPGVPATNKPPVR